MALNEHEMSHANKQYFCTIYIFVPYILLDILFNHAMPMATGGIKIDKGLNLYTNCLCV